MPLGATKSRLPVQTMHARLDRAGIYLNGASRSSGKSEKSSSSLAARLSFFPLPFFPAELGGVAAVGAGAGVGVEVTARRAMASRTCLTAYILHRSCNVRCRATTLFQILN